MTDNWYLRVEKDKDRLSDESKFGLLVALIRNIAHLNYNETLIFLAPESESPNIESVIAYSAAERKIARAFGSGSPNDWRRESFLEEVRPLLKAIYSSDEIEQLFSLVTTSGDATILVSQFARDHYGIRRIRNAYLPEITDLIEINPETGLGVDRTRALFAEGPEDSVSRIERVLGIRRD